MFAPFFLLDPSHTTCADPGVPLFGNQNNSQGYQVCEHVAMQEIEFMHWTKISSFTARYAVLTEYMEMIETWP